jgi:hypothetical protein
VGDGLEIIGAGFGRTGTLSLKTALEQLGFSPCHHMQEVMTSREQVDHWHDACEGGKPDWDLVFRRYRAACDWPSSAYWEELCDHFSDAKVILTVRDPRRWYQSTAETIYPISTRLPRWLLWAIPRLRRWQQMVIATIWEGTFDGRFEDEDHAVRVFEENSERARRVVAPDRLLVFDARDGWEPLCAFLGVPVPEGPYPHVNEAARMKRAAKALEVLRWLPLIVLAGVVAAVAWPT